jgi:hypothetical protein
MNHNENSKTACILAAAAVIVAVAWFSRPATPVKGDTEVLGKKLFPEFTDSAAVDSLEVLQFDQAKSEPVRLAVARVNGQWVIPSHGNYPADAKEHLATAANSLIDLQITGMAPGFDAASHAKDPILDQAALRAAHNRFGVVDPSKDVKSTDTGVGTRVTMKNAAGQELASAIIGKTLPDQTDQCYMRIAEKDPVYIVKLDPGAISVRFADWIEPDLLKFKTIDLKRIEIKDYSIGRLPNHRLGPTFKGEFVLDAAAGDQPWKLVKDLVDDPVKKELVPGKVGPDEELNTTNLESLKTALEDLKIVNVEPKPASVPADLRVRKLNEEIAETLSERGFYLAPVSEDPEVPLELLSNSGDITIQMADGVRYVLRFGATTGESSAAVKAKKKSDAKSPPDTAKEDATPGVDRYLFVTADFDQGSIPQPAFEKLPEAPPVEKAASPAPVKGAGAQSPANTKDAPKKVEDKKDQPGKDAPAKAEAGNKAATAKKTEPKGDSPKVDAPKAEEPKKDPVKEAKAAQDLAARRAEVERENKRKKEEYDAKVVAGRKHAQELSKRFAPWYYVIPGDTYSKIHLARKDILKKKEPPKDAAGHEHDHDHSGADLPLPPPSPAATIEQLKKDQPK